MKAYKSYKNVDLPWLKRVPEHWEVARNKNFLSEQKAIVGDNFANYSLLSLTLNGVIIRDVNNGKGKFPASFNTYKIVSPGNMVFCLFDIDETPRTVGLSTHYGMITNAYEVLGVHNITPQYLYYYYLQLDNRKALKPLYHGLRKTITIGTFLQTKLPVPPKEEQDQIVRYLDWQNSRLNKLINAKKKEIALLEEQKQALISQAVTKGLDPHAPLKDSGIDWIGQIPEHWQINKMNRLFNLIGSGTTPSSGSIDFYNNGNIPWLNSGDLYGDKPVIKKTAKHITELALNSFSTLKLYNADSIAIAMYGASVGNISIVPFEFCCNQACCVFSKPIKNLSLKYVYYNVIAGKKDLIEQAKGGGQPNINQDILKQFRLPFPPLHEQEHIVDYLTDQCAIIDDLIANINKTIFLLQEYRTRLVTDVVTGQIDVRNIAVPNYETVTETIDQPETAEDDSTISAEDQ
ncbi:MAG: restriction endonuclease subunit S [Candidatus Bruticola sp.]